MKVKSITRGEDYVRFNFKVEVEVNPGLIIKNSLMGDVSRGEGVFKHLYFSEIDDYDWEYIKLFGEEVKYKGLEKLYNTLFKKGFDTMEKEVDEFCVDQVRAALPGSAHKVPKSEIKNLLKQYLKEKLIKPVPCQGDYGKTIYVIGDWQLGAAMRVLGYSSEKFETLIAKENNFRNCWGYDVEVVNKALRFLHDY